MHSGEDAWKHKHKTKKCAQCRIDIDKDSGCNHMVCTACGYQFCWICSQPFTPDHYFNSPCRGLQFSKYPHARQRLRRLARWALVLGSIAAVVVVVGGAIVVGVPILIIAGTVVLLVGVPTLFVVVPLWLLRRSYKRWKRNRQLKRQMRAATPSHAAQHHLPPSRAIPDDDSYNPDANTDADADAAAAIYGTDYPVINLTASTAT